MQGYTAVWDDSSTVLTCVEEKKGAQHKSIIIACAVAAVAVLAAALLLWRQYLRTRPRWLRERLLQVNHVVYCSVAAYMSGLVMATVRR